jgi:two-component system, cell cycle sensor histidine kinase and response regulator CckA
MKPQLRALIIEDAEDDVRLLVRELDKGGFHVVAHRVETAEALHQALAREPWDIILCDYVLPRFNGEGALRMVRESGLDLPFIFVSGTIGEDTAVAAMKAGAHDYIMKDNLKRLVPAVRRELLDAMERKQHRAAEAQLRMSEHKYRHLFQSMREAALLIAEESDKIIDANEQAEILFGRDREEILSLSSARLYPPAPASDATGAGQSAWQSPGSWEAVVQRKNGSGVPVHVSVSRVELHDRPFLLTLFRDISQRRRAETALRTVLRHARTMVIHGTATAPDDWDRSNSGWDRLQLRWTWCFQDEEAARAVLPLELPPGVEYRDAWVAAVHPDDRESMALIAQQAFASGAPSWRQEFRCIDAHGELHWFTQAASIENTAPGQWQVITINTDITERKLAEEGLTWRTAFFEAQVNSALDGILVVNAQGEKILQNDRFIELWNFPPHVVESPDDRVQVEYAMTRTKHPEEFAAKVAYLYAHPDEISRDEIELLDGTILDRYSSPVRDKAGNYYGRIWTFRDLTERRKLEEQYRQAQKMEAVGQLAGGIAHDFNNMLTVIQMHASLLAEEADGSSDLGSGLQRILEACDRASNLTRQLLTFSRRQAKSAHPLDLGEVIGSMIRLLRRIVGEEISLETRFAPSLPVVHADSGMVEQVLMNLVVNARDAMPSGGRLTVSLDPVTFDAAQVAGRPSARAGTFACLRVTDTGGGIAPEVLPRIFEPFFTTKEIGHGTGLGLATVFGIVQQHNGWIDVTTEVGRGTTFQVFFPAHDADPALRTNGSTIATVKGGTETILLVEDDAVVRGIAAPALRQRGYTVLEAGSADEAMARWDEVKGAVDLLLTDLILPGGVSGQMLADELLRRRPNLATIYSSGYSAEILSGRLRVQDGSTYLPKPYAFRELAAIVRKRLDAAAVAGSAGSMRQ